ncbi:hypothetical protein OG563_26690 [Nocardia vinacea]|uniref:Uncharacterized protein n=1 Tax=Nocardia vinacea TaxID=96468 RepID=A0ABZ1YHY6_9NOCA|nr:hypothetical protein [Nocardia vinacea]
MSNTIVDVDDPGFDPYIPDHVIEDHVKVYLVFECGEWQLDGLIRQAAALDGLDRAICTFEQPRDDCAICSTPDGRAAIEAADRAIRPNGHDLLEMLAAEFGYELARPGRAEAVQPPIALVTQLYEMLANAKDVAAVLSMIIPAALELDERHRGGLGRVWRYLTDRMAGWGRK